MYVRFWGCLCVGIKRLAMFVYNAFMFAQMTSPLPKVRTHSVWMGIGMWRPSWDAQELLPSQAFPLALPKFMHEIETGPGTVEKVGKGAGSNSSVCL